MKKISHLTYEANIKTFHKYLEAKHEMPFREIQIKNMSDQDLQRWKEIENMRDIKIGFSFGDNVKRDIRGVSMEDQEKQKQIEQVAARFKNLCSEEIERIEDELPKVVDLFEKDKLLKEIDALEQIADEANDRAVEMIENFYKQGEK